jgi:hypothetical protein
MSTTFKTILLLGIVLCVFGTPLFAYTIPVLISTSISTQCFLLSRTLSPNSDGLDVVRLQTFLVSNNLLSSNYITGFYGSLTQSAIQNYQCAQNIVCSGSPATTGWGIVGPRTYAALKGPWFADNLEKWIFGIAYRRSAPAHGELWLYRR